MSDSRKVCPRCGETWDPETWGYDDSLRPEWGGCIACEGFVGEPEDVQFWMDFGE